MSADPEGRPVRRRRAAFFTALIAAVACLALVFHAGMTASPGSRALAVLAVVETGSLKADPWYDLTIDRALVNGHFYSEKAPLPSMLVIPFYALYRAVEHRPYRASDLDVIIALGNVLGAAIPLGLLVLVFQRRAAISAPPGKAVWIALVAALGTPLLSYGGIYFAEVLAGLLLVGAWHLATSAFEPDSPGPPDSSRPFLAGFLAGLAMLSEFVVFYGVAALGLYLLTRLGWKRGWKLALLYAAGGLPSALVVAALNLATTGSVFDLLYHHTTSIFYHYPPYSLDLDAVRAAGVLLFSQYRGLFFYAPALIVLGPLAFTRAPSRSRRLLLAGFCVVHLVFIASYWARYGGWCIGPRHLTPILVVLLYEGLPHLATSSRWTNRAFFALGATGLAMNVLAVATNPMLEGAWWPFAQLYWPAFVHGEMTEHSVFADLGLHWGRWEVAVWFALFFAFAGLLARQARAVDVCSLPPGPGAGG